jgi:putative redox protein
MTTVTGQNSNEQYRTVIKTGTNQIIADEPVSMGGQDLGFSPKELLASALIACTCATLRMYADRKEWVLTAIHVEVSIERDEQQNITHITRNVSLQGDLDDAQTKRLLSVANACPMHKILSNNIEILTSIV